MGIWCMFSGCPFVTSARDGSRSIAVEASGTGRLIPARMPRTATFRLTNSLRIGNCWSWRALHAAANKVAIPDFRGYASYFYKNKLKEAVGAAFGRYENKLDEVRDSRGSRSLRGARDTAGNAASAVRMYDRSFREPSQTAL